MERKFMLENAHKLAYLRQKYPELDSEELLKLLQVSGFDKNAAIWMADELGFIKTDTTTGVMALGMPPETWDFGPKVKAMQETIVYCFKKLAERETDMDEHFVTNWLIGYPPQDSICAIGQLVDDRVLFEYTLTDHNKKTGTSEYLYYTLFENSEMQWGKKNFKKAPKAEGEK